MSDSSSFRQHNRNAKDGELNLKKSKREPSYTEFVIIISMMMSLVALSIDAMLPALPQIGADLNITTANDRQLIVSMIFLGLAIGQLFFGPLSDSIGRKRAIYIGYALYIAGALMSVFAAVFPLMLLGRLLQGMGVSAPRSVTLALVRDRFEGREMARVMSFVMTVFILVPMIAPSPGSGDPAHLELARYLPVLCSNSTCNNGLVCAAHTGNPGHREGAYRSRSSGPSKCCWKLRISALLWVTRLSLAWSAERILAI